MKTDVDLIIIGAGCAGLSLGMQLSAMGENSPKTVLIDPRKSYQNDRTWCFWSSENKTWNNIANHHWNQFLVKTSAQSVVVDCSFAPYRVISARDFYDHVLAAISSNTALEIKTDTTVIGNPKLINGKWYVHTSNGEFNAKTIVDTRPFPVDPQSGATLWQSFLGCEIESIDPIFDPCIAHLMNFCDANNDYVGFTYLLPLTPSRALIEFTVFAERPYCALQLQGHLGDSILQYTQGGSYKVNRTEIGLIPMGIPNYPKQLKMEKTYVFAGLTAGAARPATGYAFQRIQIWAKECAISLCQNQHPIGHCKDKVLLKTMDAIFLKVIRDNPKLAPDLFISLFSKVKSQQLVRFLSDQGNLFDYLSVINALPPAPFIKHLLKRHRT
ncbi:lycopene cyclase family protein [Undibacterium sp. RTI2.1]|uniref:lycopene cyclase family protein n=1 Tax=unclassified Undibacterium TaxID=2630295 RepID=UPI002B22D7FF|nr:MULTISPECIES: lycopene cyclase family protein [unclassified Undibacterium]MEB0033025.1 lycopene cyclase family protein [Undibacterium sp. RTI2.1]MEB0118883.1 lycopene cyclase family protein [Undibacterium sp. RTI2.2]